MLQVSDLGAETTGRCVMTLGEIRDIERGVKVQGGEDDKTSPFEEQAFVALLANCSFPEGSKILLLLNKRMKLFKCL